MWSDYVSPHLVRHRSDRQPFKFINEAAWFLTIPMPLWVVLAEAAVIFYLCCAIIDARMAPISR